MSQRDLNRLHRAAVGLADRLRALRIRSLKVASTFASEEHYNGGWSTEVANWSGHGVTIAVSLDRYSRARKRSFSAGFWSRELAPVRRLLVGLPLEWRPRGRILTRKDAIPLTDRSGKKIWVLARPLPDVHFGQPVAENYGSEFRYFGMYDRADELDLDRTIGFVESVIIAQEASADDESIDIRHIERRTDLDGTEKETLIQARRGQGRFRKQLERLWGCCPISGHDRRELLRASHILPRRSADDAQRLDRYNGILLSANLDALFDKHLISFGEDGRLMVSDELSAEELRELGLTKPVTVDFSAAHKVYLRDHRFRFEKKRARRRGGPSDGG